MTASPTKDDPATRIARRLIADKTDHSAARPGVPYTLGLAANCIRAQLAVEYPPPPPKAKKPPRLNGDGRDVTFDALAEACGLDLTGLTRASAKQIATAKRDILEATPDVTAAEIHRRAAAYRAKYRDAACTPIALANHWPEFGTTSRLTRGAKKDVYVEPTGWKTSPVAQASMHASNETWAIVVARGWFNLTVDVRAAILQGMP